MDTDTTLHDVPLSAPTIFEEDQGLHVMQPISLEQAEGHLAEIIAKLSPGDEVVLTRDDKPVATIKAIAPPDPTPRKFGTLKGSILYIAPDFGDIPEGFEDYLP